MADTPKNTRQPPDHIPLDFEQVIERLLTIDAKSLPKTAAAAKQVAKKRAAAEAGENNTPAK